MTDFAELAVRGDSSDLVKVKNDMNAVAAAGVSTERKTGAAMASMSRGFNVAARAAGALAGAAVAALGSVAFTRNIAEFEGSMSRVAAISGATGAELASLRDTARDLGATTEFSASQAADGLGFLAMAGFEASEAVSAIPAVLDLATASGMGLAEAADIASNVMSGFGMEAENAGGVADVLAAASSRANTNVGQLGRAMSTVAPISSALGISLEETAAAIGVMSDAGIQGERAGTALRGVLASLSGPTDQAAEALQRYGLTVSDVNPETNSLAEIMARLQGASLSTADAMTIFGREAASGALVLAGASGRLAEFGDELSRVDGAAADMAETMRDNLGGDLNGLQSAFQGLILAIGDAGLTAVIRGAVQALTGLVRLFTSIANGVGRVITVFDNMRASIMRTGQTQDQLARSIEEVNSRLSGQLFTFNDLAEPMAAGARMSRDMAEAQLELAQNTITAIEAANAQVAQQVRQSEEYLRLQSQIDQTAQSIADLDAGPDLDGAIAPSVLLPALEDASNRMAELRWEQEGLINSAINLGPEYQRATSMVGMLTPALEDATGETIVLADEAANAADGAAMVASAAASIDFSGAISGAYSLGNNLFRALGAAQALAGQMAANDAARARIAQARLNTVGDPVAREGAVAVQEFREEFSDGGYGLIAGGRAGELAAAEREIREAAESAAALEQSVRAADEAFSSLSATASGGGGGGGGGGRSSGRGAAGAVEEVTDAMREAQQAQEEWARSMSSHFDGLITGGKEFVDVLQSMARQRESRGWEMLFQGLSGGFSGGGQQRRGGGLFGFLGGLFGGFRAEGGPVEAGKAYVVGERRAELFVPQTAGRIMPQVPSAGGGQMDVRVYVDDDGNWQAKVAQISGAVVREAAPNITRQAVGASQAAFRNSKAGWSP